MPGPTASASSAQLEDPPVSRPSGSESPSPIARVLLTSSPPLSLFLFIVQTILTSAPWPTMPGAVTEKSSDITTTLLR